MTRKALLLLALSFGPPLRSSVSCVGGSVFLCGLFVPACPSARVAVVFLVYLFHGQRPKDRALRQVLPTAEYLIATSFCRSLYWVLQSLSLTLSGLFASSFLSAVCAFWLEPRFLTIFHRGLVVVATPLRKPCLMLLTACDGALWSRGSPLASGRLLNLGGAPGHPSFGIVKTDVQPFPRQLDAKVAKIAHSSTRGGAISNLSEIVVFPRGSDSPGIVPATLRTLVPESSRTPARAD